MANSTICEESFFFLHVDSLSRRPATTCAPGTTLLDAARRMQQDNVSGIIVTEEEKPVGIFSTRDFRDVVVTHEGHVGDLLVKDFMQTGLITVRHRAYVFEAIFKMAKHNIHRLAVVDEQKNVIGVITDTDLLSLQTRSPLYLNQEMETAESIEELAEINSRILDMVHCAMRAGADTRSLVHLISHFNDAFTHRIVTLLDVKEGIRLPEGATYLALGSEGRGEQTLRTDQDSAMVYRDDMPAAKLPEITAFATRMADALEQVGVPKCPGNTMASNPQWCHSLSEWKRLIDQWISVLSGENIVSFGMFQDFRAIHGEDTLERQLHEYIFESIERNNLFFPYVAKNIVRFQPPVGMFGRLRTERRGEDRGCINLKKAGIFAITQGVSLLALERGIVHGTTWDKLDQICKVGALSENVGQVVEEAFSYLVKLRLQRQLTALNTGEKPSNNIDPTLMSPKDRDHLREALKGAGLFLRIIRDHYKLDLISR